ncbi:MAG: 1-(5-phosphoribosyl)-5-((5-phosphoribosylamino)methylideneamino)imidazole-4-carboxamide isomerase, partial [Clostridia bacterium]|nr:1-(5-phosphoribosyl)-5-((5-phosphoribosylamino)methylideneamino)imidazole-4-carboxamide isomerase [Clostridia bacterium]
GLRVEIGGGIRTEETVEKYLEKGAFRVILGTVCVTDPAFTERMAKRYGDRIAAGLDARGGMVAIKGWKEVSQLSLDEAFSRLTDSGISTVICTDISKDGAMAGINDAFYRDLVGRYTLQKGCGIVASGGVTDMDDVRRLASAGVSGIIIGRSLYDGRIRLEDALKAVRSEEK